MTDAPHDRLASLLTSGAKVNGIDFIEIGSADQKQLRVHFLNGVDVKSSLDSKEPVTITGGETIPVVKVLPLTLVSWKLDPQGHVLLDLSVAAPGDFSTYTLSLHATSSSAIVIDPFYDHKTFSFKALCDSNVDCEAPPHVCPPPVGDLPPIDYLAKDFLSFRAALSDFSALRYPEWQERNEADFGTMFMEALCSVADDLSYLQDRIAAEATLETATQRKSIVRHARLVDYEPRPAVSSHVMLQFDVSSGGTIGTGVRVSTLGVDATRVDFETSVETTVSPLWNRLPNIVPYVWDASEQCLPAGSTDAWIAGTGHNFSAGQQLLIETRAAVDADPPIRQIVTLIGLPEESTDPLFVSNVTHIAWRPEDQLLQDRDVARTIFAGNLVPATQGRQVVETFAIPGSGAAGNLAIVRDGPRVAGIESLQYLYTLAESPLVWLPSADGTSLVPQITLTQGPGAQRTWEWVPRIVDAFPSDAAFSIEPFRMRAVARNSDDTISHDYDGNGETIRFGDGTFGEAPPEGAVFEVSYRVGDGVGGNVAADAITWIAPNAPPFITSVTNPFAAEGGADAEPDETVRRLAPQAFRTTQLRAVRSEDYVRAAETLRWVSNAGSAFRWTGSWLTVFTTVDPRVTEEVSVDQEIELIDLLNRYRLAGYESYALPPRFTSLDLLVVVCARSDAFRGDVEQAVREALSTKQFFNPDAFTFGTPLERSRLEAAVQSANGVGGILSLRFRRRGQSSSFADVLNSVPIAKNEILRVDNDPSRPERGSIRIQVEGGK
ncbi:MAG TPA: hypothetical protein VN380_12775 [Thermoanaerobaculia bacterium]|jgi:hypothetical protein|nr:hypothetical protein [Thermoanaerobaculia bacterium]